MDRAVTDSQDAPKKRTSRLFGLALVGTALLALALQAGMYVSVIDKTVGTFASLGRTQLFGARVTRLEVGIVKSDRNAQLAGSNPEYYFDLARQWEAVLKREGIRYRLIGDNDLTAGIDTDLDVVVLPRVVALSPMQKANLRTYLSQGKGVIASGPVGVRDNDGQWAGWQFFSEITGLQSPRTVRVLDSVYLTFRGHNYFSDKVPAGFTVDLPRQEVTLGSTAEPDAFWSDWRNRPALEASTPAQLTLATHNRYRSGRGAWFGFTETALGKQGKDRRTLDDYMASMVRWSGQQPVAVLADWPGRSRGAAVIADEIVDSPQSAMPAAELMKREQVRATFVLSPAQAVAGRNVLKSLAEAGEVAASPDAPEVLEQPGAARQTEQLRLVRADAGASGMVPVLGFQAPVGVLSKDSLKAIEDSGYRWFFDRSTGGRAIPELTERVTTGLLRMRQPGVTRIYATAPGDVETVAAYDGPTPWGEGLAEQFHQEIRRTADVGGLYTLFMRSDVLGAPENLHVLQSVIGRMKKESVWIATAGEVADWWSARDRIHVESHLVNAHRIRVAVTNRGGDTLPGVSVRLFLPWRPQKVRVLPAIVGRGVPNTQLLDKDDALELDFAPLLPQTSYVFLIALDER